MEKTATSLLNAELLATCSALGSLENGRYYRSPECLQSLKDLIRYLRQDDESHEVRRQLGSIGIVETDLLPIIKTCGQEKNIFDVTLRLLVNLTNPAILLYKEELPQEKVSRNYYQECVDHLQKVKSSFTNSLVWNVLAQHLRPLLGQDWEQTEEDDNLVIERILILTRNVLHVPANPEEEMRTDDDVSIHDQVIWALHTSGMTDLIVYIAANEDTENFSFHVIEIIFHMLREQEPEQLASSGQARPMAEKMKDVQILSEVISSERARKVASKTPTRHPRFGGTYCLKNVKSVSERDMIVHQPMKDINSLNFDVNKKVTKIPKNRRPQEDMQITRRSTLNIRILLKDFCSDLLENAYNSFMTVVKDHLTKRKAQDHDESYYLWAFRFLMEFRRLSKMDISRVSETVSKQSYHYIHTQIENYCEMMITDKQAVQRWAKRTYLALRAYKELVMTLSSMMVDPDKKVSQSGKVISGTIFYVMEYRDLPLHLLNIYDPQKFPKSFLKDLVEMTHVFLKTLEFFCGQHKHIIVQKKKKSYKKKTKSGDSKTRSDQANITTEEMWDALSEALSQTLQGEAEDVPMDIVPFDATSDKGFEEQKTEALVKIQDALREKRPGLALALLHASRELWPEGEVFGTLNNKPEMDFLLLREIFFTDLPRTKANSSIVTEPLPEDEEEDNDDESHHSECKISEQEFNFSEFIKRFARPKVVQAYCLLLSRYHENSGHTNHCLLKMMHRIAWDHKMHGLFFQSSVFRTFQRLFDDPANRSSQILKELCRFSTFIMRKFFETAEKNSKVFMELLFWKTSKEVYEIQEGYGTMDKSKALKVSWSEEEEEELKTLFQRFSTFSQDGKDAIDAIQENFSNQTKTRRQIILYLKTLGLVENPKIYRKKTVNLNLSKIWREEEVELLVELFEKFKLSTDILGRIWEGLQMKKSKKSISQKLLDLALVTDRKQLHKKKARKNCDIIDNHDSDSSDSERLSSSSEDNCSGANITSHSIDLIGLKEAYQSVLSQGLLSSVEWLKRELESEADDRQKDDDWEAVPLVPLSEDHSLAMSNSHFNTLLTAIGITPPASEQETFWRIPRTLSPAQLKSHVAALNQGGHLQEETEPNQSYTNEMHSAVKKKTYGKDLHSNARLANFESTSELSSDEEVQKIPRKRAKLVVINSDEDD